MKKHMRIAMIGFRGIPHSYGGGEDLVRYLAPGLAERGHEVFVYCRSNLFRTDRAPVYRGVRRLFLPTFEHKFLGQFIHATLAAIDAMFRRVDIVYIHTLPSGIHSLLPWLTGRVIVVNPNGFDWERAKWGSIGKAYFKISLRVCLMTARHFVTDAKAIQTYYRERFQRDSTFVAYGAEPASSVKPELLKQLDVRPGEYYLIACRLVPENSIELMIRGFVSSNSRKTLIVAGSANYEDEWTRRLHNIKDPRVRFVGHISDQELLRELHCNAFAYFHGHTMGGTNPSLIKALALGNCILAVESPFNREVLIDEHGRSFGLLFDREEGSVRAIVEQIEADDRRAQELRKAAPDRVRDAYSIEHIVDGYEQAFQLALDPSSHS
jgi:glycosyltransferase involved in cell wall biosynthesis